MANARAVSAAPTELAPAPPNRRKSLGCKSLGFERMYRPHKRAIQKDISKVNLVGYERELSTSCIVGSIARR